MNQTVLAALPLALLASAPLASAQCGVYDPFEDNDSCATAAFLENAAYSGLAVHGPNAPNGADDDWYSLYGASSGQAFVVQVIYDTSNHQLEAELYPDGPCTTTMIAGVPTSYGLRIDAPGNSTGWPLQDYGLLVRSTGTSACTDYEILYTTDYASCSSSVAVDDFLEENDTCGTSTAIPPGSYTDLFVSRGDNDYYAIEVPAGELLSIDLDYDQQAGIAHATLYADDACSVLLDEDPFGNHDRSLQWPNPYGVPTTVYLRCWSVTGLFNDSTCTDYDLHVTTTPVPCLAPGSDDGFEDNDTCNTAAPLTDGTYAGLLVVASDQDIYSLDLAPGALLSVQAQFSHAAGDVDLFLYNSTQGCDPFGPNLQQGVTTTDNEIVNHANGPHWRRVYVRVAIKYGSDDVCNQYDLIVSGAAAQPISTICLGDDVLSPCPCGNPSSVGSGEGCAHSQGHGAALVPSGSRSVAADDLSLNVVGAVPNQTAMLLEGSRPMRLAFKDGLLCAGSPTQRLEPLFLDQAGNATSSPSIASLSGSLPGDVRVYQVWFRDPAVSPCGSGSNLTAGALVYWN